MKRLLKPNIILPWFTLAAGGLGLILRIWLLTGGVDEKGLLVTGHPANILTFILTAVTMAVLFLCVRPLGGAPDYNHLFPLCLPAVIGNGVAAAGIAVIAIRQLMGSADTFSLVSGIIGLIAACSLAYLGWCRLKRLRPSFVFHAAVTGYLMLYTISQYRGWGSESQISV